MKKSILIGFLWMVSIIIWGQATVDSNTIVIPSLDTILNTALANSPLLKSKQLEAESLNLELKLQNKHWTNYLFIEGA
ncbi:MAG: hypothetical protein MI922_09115, partial [Bacteroidales bacterium]|nr:hypothetical protein [Bacteroidales bacterium]